MLTTHNLPKDQRINPEFPRESQYYATFAQFLTPKPDNVAAQVVVQETERTLSEADALLAIWGL